MKKFNVPYYEQNKKYMCGCANLRMAAAYLGRKRSYPQIKRLVRTLNSGMVLAEGIAVGGYELGLGVRYYGKDLSLNTKLPYIKKGLGKDGLTVIKELKEKIKAYNIEVKKKNISLKNLLGYLTKNSLPIVLVNSNVLDRKPGHNGHYLTIVGHDKKTIYVHNSGTRWPFPYWPIKKTLFEEAWSSRHADKKTIILYKK